MHAAVTATSHQLSEAETARGNTEKEAEDLRTDIESLKKRLTGRRALLEVVDKEFHEVKEQKDELESERKYVFHSPPCSRRFNFSSSPF